MPVPWRLHRHGEVVVHLGRAEIESRSILAADSPRSFNLWRSQFCRVCFQGLHRFYDFCVLGIAGDRHQQDGCKQAKRERDDAGDKPRSGTWPCCGTRRNQVQGYGLHGFLLGLSGGMKPML